ncbi:MAG: HEAT repeat domain-containing protein [Gemmataceae bacterium]
MIQLCRSLLAAGLCVLVLAPLPAQDTIEAADEKLLKEASLPVDGPGLLAFFKARTTANAAHIKEMVDQLGKEEPALHREASRELIRIGAASLPELRKALQKGDVNLSLRIRECLKHIDKGADVALQSSALRLLADRKPEGAFEVLLTYCGQTRDVGTKEEVKLTLQNLGFHKREPIAALLEGLKSNNAANRATCLEILAEKAGLPAIDQLKPLLQDKDLNVRVRAALVLTDLREAEALPVLFAALEEAPLAQAQEVEKYLRELVGVRRAPGDRLGGTAESRKQCRQTWAEWWMAVDDKALLDHFRNQTLTDARRKEILDMIHKQGSDDFSTREDATDWLIKLGAAGVPLLQQALDDADAEIVERTRRCLERIGKSKAINPAEASRLLALRKPPAGAEVLLAYVPFAHDDDSSEQLQSALNALAYRQGAPDKAVIDGLSNPVAVRRAAASVALAQRAEGRKLPKIRELLNDRDPLVRRDLALAFIDYREKDAVPVLIDLIGDLPREDRWQVEDVLHQLAEGDAPPPPADDDAKSRDRYRAAWAAWWSKEQNKIDLAKLDDGRTQLGYTLLVLPTNGKVVEIGRDGKQRWAVTGLQHPFDAQFLPGNRVLVAEYLGSRVTERNMKGEVVWQTAANRPISCQRLPNGNTFIACRNQLIEVDRSGKELYKITRGYDILSAQKLRNGEIACLVNSQRLLRLDTKGKELKAISVGPVSGYVQFDMLPDGGVVVPQQGLNKVVEYDADGKERWHVNVNSPFSAEKLPGGRVLVTNMNQGKVMEVDRSGKVIWEQSSGGASWRARRR